MKDSVRWYLGFVVFRIINVFFIQTQFDPDEYWQNLEPSYCQVFVEAKDDCPGLTWEWKRRPASIEIHSFADALKLGLQGPVRSYASVLPTLLFYSFIKHFGFDSSWMVSRGPLILNAVLVASSTDWAIWYSSRWISPSSPNKPTGQRGESHPYTLAFWCAYCSLTSWFNAYALVRTYSNSVETALLSLSLALVSPVGRRFILGSSQ
jgi:GPI mannosyltransferase 3